MSEVKSTQKKRSYLEIQRMNSDKGYKSDISLKKSVIELEKGIDTVLITHNRLRLAHPEKHNDWVRSLPVEEQQNLTVTIKGLIDIKKTFPGLYEQFSILEEAVLKNTANEDELFDMRSTIGLTADSLIEANTMYTIPGGLYINAFQQFFLGAQDNGTVSNG